MKLAGVRRQLTESREALVESAAAATRGEHDPAYRGALKSRNLLFHATRGVCAARGEDLPEMPAVGISGGALDDHLPALAAVDAALACEDDPRDMPPHLAAAKSAYARYLGWLRAEVGKLLHRLKRILPTMSRFDSKETSDLKLIYRVLHSHLMDHTELMDSPLFAELQSFLQSCAKADGVDLADHRQWDAWLDQR